VSGAWVVCWIGGASGGINTMVRGVDAYASFISGCEALSGD
jgi:hypothetical protein